MSILEPSHRSCHWFNERNTQHLHIDSELAGQYRSLAGMYLNNVTNCWWIRLGLFNGDGTDIINAIINIHHNLFWNTLLTRVMYFTIVSMVYVCSISATCNGISVSLPLWWHDCDIGTVSPQLCLWLTLSSLDGMGNLYFYGKNWISGPCIFNTRRALSKEARSSAEKRICKKEYWLHFRATHRS